MSSPDRVVVDPSTVRRFDIELLRVVAVVGVVLFHFAPGMSLVPNGFLGVDVFFTVSGFVITAQMLRSWDRGRLTYPDFLARRVRRLLPSAVVVIVVTYAVVWASRNVILIDSERSAAIAALLYASNFLFAAQTVDYFATIDAPSPFLHYWSLSVEEQFYLIWPVVLIALAFAVRRRPAAFRRAVLGTALALSVVSLLAAWWSMRVAPEQTFFMPWARAHQLLIGAAAAVVVHAMSLAATRGSGGPAGWLVRNPVPAAVLTPLRVGAVALLIALLVVPQFEIASPGPVALLVSIPVAFIALTGNGTDLLSRLGGWWPLAWIARLSYVIYLWHWPVWVVVIAQLGHLRGREQLAVAGAVTLVLSLATHFAVEQPFRDGYRVRRMPPLRTAVLGLGASVLAAAVVLAAAAVAPTRPWQQDVRPPIEELASDTSDIYDRECQSVSGWTRAKVCTDGPEGGQKVMIIGDSHGASWATPMQSLAEQEQWQYFNVTKARCSIWDVPTLLAGKRYVACEKWRVNALRAATEERPDVIVLHSTIPWEQMLDDEGQPVADRAAALGDAVTASVRAMRRTGATVVAMLDTPTATAKDGVPVESCLATADDPAECDFPSRSGSPERAVLREAAEKAGAVVVDPYPAICPDSVCTVVQDGVVVYRDAGHLTRTYALDQRQWVRSWLRPLLAARPGQ